MLEPHFGRKHEAKTLAGQMIEDTVDSLTLGTLGGTAGKIVDKFLVDKFFDDKDNDD